MWSSQSLRGVIRYRKAQLAIHIPNRTAEAIKRFIRTSAML
jgi:hypothetical protein